MIELRATLPADLDGLDRLFRQQFGHGISAAEWRWKYQQVPGSGRSVVAVDDDGRILAHAGALAHRARTATGDGLIWQLVDWVGLVVGSGLRPPLVRLGRFLLADLPGPADLPWIYGFPSQRHFELGQRVFGYRPLPAIIPLVGALADVCELASRPAPTAVEGEGGLQSSDHCGDWVEATWLACGVSGVCRTATFLNWRYHARPDRYYRFYRLLPLKVGAEDSSDTAPDDSHAGLAGLAVFAFVGREAAAAELWLPGAGEQPARWLPALLAVADDLRRAGIERWRFWPYPGLGADGWSELNLQPAELQPMGCRGRRGGPDPRPAAAGFFYAMGDYDLV